MISNVIAKCVHPRDFTPQMGFPYQLKKGGSYHDRGEGELGIASTATKLTHYSSGANAK